jgi:lipid-A-disaccharide synthase
VFIGVDAPDFNLGLEKVLKRRGIPTVHYVSPSIWAWRGERIHKIGAAVSRVLALFPFEPALYEKQGIPVSYVGHPLADMLPLEDGRDTARTLLGLSAQEPVFALLPGSRQSELQYMAETFIETARRIHDEIPEAVFLVPLATRETRALFEGRAASVLGAAIADSPAVWSCASGDDGRRSFWSPAARRPSRRHCSSDRWSSPTRWRRCPTE